MANTPRSPLPLQQAFDELRFGARRTLNLRTTQPTVPEALARCEQWLRQQQIDGATETLVITGRGLRSIGGTSPVREAIARLLPSLRRRNVVASYQEHTPGSFVVVLAPVSALFEVPKRRREAPTPPVPMHPQLMALEPDTTALLIELARLTLDELGVKDVTMLMIGDEMLRQFDALSPAIGQSRDAEARLQQALLRAIEDFETR